MPDFFKNYIKSLKRVGGNPVSFNGQTRKSEISSNIWRNEQTFGKNPHFVPDFFKNYIKSLKRVGGNPVSFNGQTRKSKISLNMFYEMSKLLCKN